MHYPSKLHQHFGISALWFKSLAFSLLDPGNGTAGGQLQALSLLPPRTCSHPVKHKLTRHLILLLGCPVGLGLHMPKHTRADKFLADSQLEFHQVGGASWVYLIIGSSWVSHLPPRPLHGTTEQISLWLAVFHHAGSGSESFIYVSSRTVFHTQPQTRGLRTQALPHEDCALILGTLWVQIEGQDWQPIGFIASPPYPKPLTVASALPGDAFPGLLPLPLLSFGAHGSGGGPLTGLFPPQT